MLLPLVLAAHYAVSLANAQSTLAAKANEARLAKILSDWQSVESRVKDVRKRIRCTVQNRLWKTEDVTVISVLARKNELLRVDISDADGKAKYTFVETASSYRRFDYDSHKEYTFEGGKNLLGPFDSNGPPAGWLDLMNWICMAFDIKRLDAGFLSSLVGEDEHFAYITFKKRRSEKPKAGFWRSLFEIDFRDMTIALRKSDFQPREIRLVQPSGDVTRWEFLDIKTNLDPPVTREMIEADLPTGWKK